MSNQILKSDLAATAHQRKAPLGLRKAVNQRKSSFTTNSSTGMISSNNPILKPPTRRDNDSYDHDDRNLSEIDDKLLAFQNEVQQTENEQKARLEEDDDIVERRLQQVHEREEKIKASIAGEKIAVEDPLQKLPHHQMLLEKKQNNNGDHDDAKDDNDENQKPSLIPKKVEDNLYTEAYYLREKERQAKKQAKLEEEKAAKEQEAKERKRRGTLANLAIKMKLNPEKYEGVALPTTATVSETKSDGAQDTAPMKIPTPPSKE